MASSIRFTVFASLLLFSAALLLQAAPDASARPESVTPPVPETPRINGASVFGVHPGSPFFYAVPVTGKRPMSFSAQSLPQGLTLDEATGRITGRLATAAAYDVTLVARNDLGSAQKKFHIVVGEDLALTPPMGWSSWNCYLGEVDQKKILAQAHALVEARLDQHGFSYINVDDAWQGRRSGKLNAIQPNADRFPDIKGMVDEIHGLGLKAGIYSTPWVTSYDRHVGGSSSNANGAWDDSLKNGKVNKNILPFAIGPYHFFSQDAQQWAEWGFDYLKFDWFPNEVPETKEMADALRASGRDIVYSLSNQLPFKNAKDLTPLCNLWRISNDIRDNWGSLNRNGFEKDAWAPYQMPGHYNDPDMMVVGYVFGHPCKLSPDEQYAHVSLWCLLSAPLILGCDLTKLDPFTLSLLTNDEVLDIDQDPLVKQATVVSKQGDALVYAKPLADGAIAVGLFNLGPEKTAVTASWAALSLTGKQVVHDLWRQKDIGTFDDFFTRDVPSHGVVLLKISPAH